jgi:hypothetical protein
LNPELSGRRLKSQLSLVTCCEIQHPASSIQHPVSSIQQQQAVGKKVTDSEIQYPVSSIEYPESRIQNQASSIQQ